MRQVPDGAFALHFTAFVALFFSLIFFYVCENFQLEVPSPSSSSSSINSIDTSHQEEDGGSNAQLSNTTNNVDHQSPFQCTSETENQVTSSLASNNKMGGGILTNARAPETAVGIAWWRRFVIHTFGPSVYAIIIKSKHFFKRWTIEGLLDRFRSKEKEKQSDGETIGVDFSSNSPNDEMDKMFGETTMIRYQQSDDETEVRRRPGNSEVRLV